MGAAADHEQARLRNRLRQPRHRVEQQIEAAMALHARDDADHAVLGREAERRAQRRVGRPRREALEVDRAEALPAPAARPAAARCAPPRAAKRRAGRR